MTHAPGPSAAIATGQKQQSRPAEAAPYAPLLPGSAETEVEIDETEVAIAETEVEIDETERSPR